jgi:hypothetical protein
MCNRTHTFAGARYEFDTRYIAHSVTVKRKADKPQVESNMRCVRREERVRSLPRLTQPRRPYLPRLRLSLQYISTPSSSPSYAHVPPFSVAFPHPSHLGPLCFTALVHTGSTAAPWEAFERPVGHWTMLVHCTSHIRPWTDHGPLRCNSTTGILSTWLGGRWPISHSTASSAVRGRVPSPRQNLPSQAIHRRSWPLSCGQLSLA